MREIAHKQSQVYPAMFCDSGDVEGPFKPEKLDTIAFKLKERVKYEVGKAYSLSFF